MWVPHAMFKPKGHGAELSRNMMCLHSIPQILTKSYATMPTVIPGAMTTLENPQNPLLEHY